MPYKIDSLPVISSRIESDIKGRLGEARLARVRRQPLARVDAGIASGLYDFQQKISKNILPTTADEEGLLQHAELYNVPRKPADYAYGTATFKGAIGTIIAANSLWQRSDGVLYRVKQETTLSEATALVEVICQQAGKLGNANYGETLTAVATTSGIQQVTVFSITNGSDIEDIERWRQRIVMRARKKGQGGNAADFEEWALEITGITRAWVYKVRDAEGNKTLGLTAVAVVCDEQEETIIPDENKVKEVQAHLESKGPCPGEVAAFAPVSKRFNPKIGNLQPDSEATRKAVYDELADLLMRDAVPGGTLLVSHVRESISIATNENDHKLLEPTEDITVAPNEILEKGIIQWADNDAPVDEEVEE